MHPANRWFSPPVTLIFFSKGVYVGWLNERLRKNDTAAAKRRQEVFKKILLMPLPVAIHRV